MCVIFMVNDKRPDDKMIEQAFDANDDGAGIAWREGNGKHREVVWAKGLDLKEIKELCASVPMPYVAHFRIASCGGVTPKLTHPFPIEEDSKLDLTGRTKGRVLFHNGHWSKWQEDRYSLDVAMRTGIHIPLGKAWSDTRVMAWLCSIYGLGFMDWLGEKGCAVGPDDTEVFTGRDGWKKVNDVWCSNDSFTFRSRGMGMMRPACRWGKCIRMDTDETGYCFEHRGKQDPNVQLVEDVINKRAEVGGASTPFPALELAELMHKEKNCSKQYLKRVRRYWYEQGEAERKALRPKQNLMRLPG